MVMADKAVPACQPTVDGDSRGEKKEGTEEIDGGSSVFWFLFFLSLLSFPFVMICSEAHASHTWVLGCREGNNRILFDHLRKDSVSWVVFSTWPCDFGHFDFHLVIMQLPDKAACRPCERLKLLNEFHWTKSAVSICKIWALLLYLAASRRKNRCKLFSFMCM